MATITKKDLVAQISEESALTQVETARVIQLFLDSVIRSLASGNRIELRNFGIFEPKRRAPKKARNPRTGQTVEVPSRTVVAFKPGKVMRELVNHR